MVFRPLDPSFPRAWLQLWLRTAGVGTVLIVTVFGGYEMAERLWMQARLPPAQLFTLHVVRGVGAAILIGTVSLFSLWRSYRAVEATARERTQQTMRLAAHLGYQEKLAALGVLAAGIAHDIGNPLASMSSELEMMEAETDPDQMRASVGVLRGQVSRIDRTLREMRDFVRRRGDDPAGVRVAAAVEDALRMVRHHPRARRVHIDVGVAPDLPPLRLIEDHLVMVLVNLFLNAFDAIGEVGGTLAVRARAEEGSVTIAVSDDGAGMSEEVRRRATAPLFTTKEEGRGTGLGLAVTADLVRAADGTLDIASAPGRGTTVTLRLPAGGGDGRAGDG